MYQLEDAQKKIKKWKIHNAKSSFGTFPNTKWEVEVVKMSSVDLNVE